MTDATVWIAALTGATAIVASWVASRGAARAAEIASQSAAQERRVEKLRETRRAAYVDLITQAHTMESLYWEIKEAVKISDPTAQQRAIADLRVREHHEFETMCRIARIIELEGPDDVGSAGRALRRSTAPFFEALNALAEGNAEAMTLFEESYRPFWDALTEFITSAAGALRKM
ncbi:hypothetical protein [Streptomyces sp. NPDC054804]